MKLAPLYAALIGTWMMLGSPTTLAASPDDPSVELPPDEAFADDHYYTAYDPGTRRITSYLQDSTGRSLTYVIDQATSSVYFSDSSGGSAAVPIAYLAGAYSQGNSARYAEFMQSIQGVMSGEKALSLQFTPHNVQLAPPNGIVRPCDLGPCGVLRREYQNFPSDSFFRWNVENIDYSYQNFYTPEQIAEDREDFDRWRAQQCESNSSEFFEALLGYLAAAGICPTAATVIGGAAFAGTLGSGIKDHNDALTAGKNCRMRYPGPRRWGR